eukprot:gene34138-biopygen15880
MTQVTYDSDDVEMLDMHTEQYRVVPGEQVDEWDAALEESWRSELGESSLTELAVQMQGAALQDTTLGNYRPKATTFQQLCVTDGRSWLPTMKATVRLYMAHLMSKGTIKVAIDAGCSCEEGTMRSWLIARHVAKVHAHGLALRPTGRAKM